MLGAAQLPPQNCDAAGESGTDPVCFVLCDTLSAGLVVLLLLNTTEVSVRCHAWIL